MDKVGRNDPCPCRSGKKYKKCCGSQSATESRSRTRPDAAAPQRLPEAKEAQTNLQIPVNYQEWSLPGQRFALTLTPENPSGSPGAYRATFALHRPGCPLDTGQNAFAAELLEGDSYLKLKDSANLKVEVRMGGSSSAPLHAITSRNSRGFVAKFKTDPFQARDLADARRIAFRTLAPLLSLWSIECNIPISIYRMDIIEQATSSRSTDVVAPFPELEFNPPTNPVGLKFRGYAKLYRESLRVCPRSPV